MEMGKYTEDGILGRVFGINTIPAETELNKYDMISYNYGYYELLMLEQYNIM